MPLVDTPPDPQGGLVTDQPAPLPVTGIDRAQAAWSGIPRWASNVVGAVPDAAWQLYNLGKAGFGYSMGMPQEFPVSNDRYPVSDAIANTIGKFKYTPTSPSRPDDPVSRYLATATSMAPFGAAGLLKGAPGYIPKLWQLLKSGTSAAVPGLAGQAVAEHPLTENESANNALSALAQVTAGAAMPRIPGEPIKGREQQNAAIENWRERGGVFPPATTNPTETHRFIESAAGKQNVQQAASLTNQHVANETAREAIGLPPTPKGQASTISDDEITDAKTAAAPGRDAIKGVGRIRVDPQFQTDMQAALSQQSGAGRMAPALKNVKLGRVAGQLGSLQSFTGADAVDTIAELREQATQAYRSGAKSDGGAYRGVAEAIEDQIERELTKRGQSGADILQNYRDSRQQFAKIYSIDEARNQSTGNVDANNLRAQLKRKVPLSGGLLDIANAAGQAPLAFKEPTHSTATSHLGLLPSVLMGGMALAHEAGGGPLSTAGMVAAGTAGAIQGGRYGARRYALGPAQENLIPRQKGSVDPAVLAAFLTAPRG